MAEFLLKYSPVIFKEGELAFRSLPSLLTLLGIVVLLLVVLLMVYKKTTLQISQVMKGTFIGLKFAVIALLLFMILEPIVTVSTVVPRKSSLVVLVDDSKSMTIKDAQDHMSRSAYSKKLIGNETAPGLIADLEKNFKIQMYRFASNVEYIRQADKIAAEGEATNLAESLRFAEDVANQSPVAGVVVITDGANNGVLDPLEVASMLKARNLPVYVVGVGSEQAKDIEVSKIAANHSVIENSVVEINALIKNKNFENEEIELVLTEGGRIVKTQTEILRGSATRVSMKFSPQKRGFGRYTLTAKAKESEAITENNSRSFLIDNRNKKSRVLYIEGYPRYDFKFIRRALDGDDSIELVSLLRTGKDKFYRQGIKDQNELKAGYPKTKEELFKYDAIIFGSIEAEFFTRKQLQNTLEFVSKRGGGFLMIGGTRSFAQGGYGGTNIEKLLPVELPFGSGPTSATPATFSDRFKLVLTPGGLKNPILQLSPVESENQAYWEKLPALEGYNPLGRAKPGATVLAVHPLSEIDDPTIIMAQQRFGRGRSMAFATSSSWLWQMGMAHEEMSHERFWRQMLRWLSLSAPKHIEGHLDKETYTPREKVTLNVDVRDSTFKVIEDATIKATVTTPSGKSVEK